MLAIPRLRTQPRLSRDEAESWLPPMSIPESRQWSDNLAGQRSNLACAGRGGERLNQPNGMISYESESEKEDKLVSGGCAKDKLVTGGCAEDSVLEEEEKVELQSKPKAPKRRFISEIFEMKEDVEKEKPPEIESVLKRLVADEVSITVTKFRWLSERLAALRSNGISFDFVGGNSNSTDEEKESEMLCPVCRVFNTATVTTANAHIDDCLSMAMKKNELWLEPSLNNPKLKVSKKRSLAEILTVTPQINAVGDRKLTAEAGKEDENEENGEEFANFKRSTNNNVTKKKKLKKVITRKKNKVERRGFVILNDESKKINKRRKKLNKEFTAKKLNRGKFATLRVAFTAYKIDAEKRGGLRDSVTFVIRGTE
ncbi:hypothetical protein glysoja_020890 [Glycine soja]|nr:hypothetical protein glysoja_020890 [Glycine soja]